MHPIFQWLDYQYDDYGGFARLTDERYIGGFKNRLIAGVNLHNGDDRQQAVSTTSRRAIKGALLSSSRDKSENTSAYAENSFFFLPYVAFVAGTQFLHATRERTDRFLSNGDQSGADGVRRLEPENRLALGRRSDLAGVCQHLAQRRGAELRRERSNMQAASVFTDLKAADRNHLRDRHARPPAGLHLGPRALSRRHQERVAVLCSARSATATSSTPTRPSTRASRSASARRCSSRCSSTARRPTSSGSTSPTRFNDFRFDNDAIFGDNQLPGAPRHFLRSELLYKHPSGVFFGPNVEWVPQAYYVDSDNTTQDGGLCHLGSQARLRQRRAVLGLHRRPQPVGRGLHRQRQHHRQGRPGVAPVRAGNRPRCVCGREVSMVKHRSNAPQAEFSMFGESLHMNENHEHHQPK